MSAVSLRTIVFSEFALKAPSARSKRMENHQIASDLLRHRSQVRRVLPERRMPRYPDFTNLVYAVHGQSKEAQRSRHDGVYESLLELRKRQLDRNIVNRTKSMLSTRLAHGNRTTHMDYTNMSRMLAQKQAMLRNNLMLLLRMHEIKQAHGQVDSFNRSFPSPRPNYIKIKAEAAALLRENNRLGCRLLSVKSKVKSQSLLHSNLSFADNELPKELLRKYSSYMPISFDDNPNWTPKGLLRPLIFFDLAVPRSQHLGRICIRLYTEVSPEVVLEFVRLATDNDFQAHRILYIFPDLWVEGQLALQSRDALHNHHEHPSPLDASHFKGVLSYSPTHRERFPHGQLIYTISLKKLVAMPDDSVIFGRVVRGMRILEFCQTFGSRAGRPKKNIKVVKCGLL